MNEAIHPSPVSAPDYFTHFGLKREPFAQTVDSDFFFSESEGGERASLSRSQRLNLLLHLAPYSDVLLVTGESGIGKTTLLHQFLARIDPSWRVCAVNAGPKVNNEVVYQCLVREFAKEESTHPAEAGQIESLREHIRALRESALSPILIIDDAHELSDQVLVLVLRLIQTDKDAGKLLSVIMFSDPAIESKLAIDELKPLRNLISHSFELTPFNEEDTAKYIIHRLNVAGLTGESPFTPAVIKVIHGTSHGIPGRINELAQVVLNNSAALEPAPLSFGMPPKTDMFKRYGPVGVIAVLLVVVLLFQDNINALFTPDHASTSTEIVAGRHEQAENDQLPDMVMQQEAETSEVEQGVRSDMEQSLLQEVTEEGSVTGMIERIPVLDPDAAPEDNPTGNVGDPSGELKTRTPELVPLATDGANIIDGRDNRKITTVEVVVTDSEKQVTTVDAAAIAETSSVPKPQPVAQDKSVEAKLKVTATPAGAIHREDWLLEQNPQHYTLQLMAIREEATIVKFIKDHDMEDKAAYFNTDNNGKEWLAIVYGTYPTRDAALAASKQLSASLTGIKPWARSIASVHASIKDYRSSQ